MNFKLPKIYPITDAKISKLSHLEQVKEFIKGGATFIQLREKYASPREFYEAAKEVLGYTRGSEVKIIINDRVDIARAVRADGVHLGQEDLPSAEARKILGREAIIGFSTHNIEQAISAVRSDLLDYIAIGPVFATTTKENPDPVVGVEGVKTVRRAIKDFPLVAIGGIDFENAASVIESGADSLALISSLLISAESLNKNTARFIKHL